MLVVRNVWGIKVWANFESHKVFVFTLDRWLHLELLHKVILSFSSGSSWFWHLNYLIILDETLCSCIYLKLGEVCENFTQCCSCQSKVLDDFSLQQPRTLAKDIWKSQVDLSIFIHSIDSDYLESALDLLRYFCRMFSRIICTYKFTLRMHEQCRWN